MSKSPEDRIIESALEEVLGGDIPAEIRSTTTVKIVATGLGNPDPDAGGACCTAFSMRSKTPKTLRMMGSID